MNNLNNKFLSFNNILIYHNVGKNQKCGPVCFHITLEHMALYFYGLWVNLQIDISHISLIVMALFLFFAMLVTRQTPFQGLSIANATVFLLTNL